MESFLAKSNVSSVDAGDFPVVNIKVDCDKHVAKAFNSIMRGYQKDSRRQAAIRMLLNENATNKYDFLVFDSNVVLFDGINLLASDDKKTQRILESINGINQMMNYGTANEVADFISSVIPILSGNCLLKPKLPLSSQFLRVLAVREIIKLNPIFGILDYVDEIEKETFNYVEAAGLITHPRISDDAVDQKIKSLIKLLDDNNNLKKIRRILTMLCDHDRSKFDNFCKWIARVELGPRFFEKLLRQPSKVEVLTTNAVTFSKLVLKDLLAVDNITKPVDNRDLVLAVSFDGPPSFEPFIPEKAIVIPNGGPVVNPQMPSLTTCDIYIKNPKGPVPSARFQWIDKNDLVTMDDVEELECDNETYITEYSLYQLTKDDNVPCFLNEKFQGKIVNITCQDDVGNFETDVLGKLVSGEKVEYRNKFFGKQQFYSAMSYTILSHVGNDIVKQLANNNVEYNEINLGENINSRSIPFVNSTRITLEERSAALTLLVLWGLALTINKTIAIGALEKTKKNLENPLDEFMKVCCTKHDDGAVTRDAFFSMYRKFFLAYTGNELMAKNSPQFYKDNNLLLIKWSRNTATVKKEIEAGYELEENKKPHDKYCFIQGYELKPQKEVDAIICEIEKARINKQKAKDKYKDNIFAFLRHMDRVADYVKRNLLGLLEHHINIV